MLAGSARSLGDYPLLTPDPAQPLEPAEFERQLRANGHSYHTHHPLNVLLNAGKASEQQIRGWVANRFYFQINIPIKDAAILANCTDREVRREWILRILDQDGHGADPGAIESWVRLGQAVGLKDTELWSLEHVLPGVRFAVDAYVNLARRQPWQEAVCASLTELLAPEVHRERLVTWATHYPWIQTSGLDCFRERSSLHERNVEHALRITLEHFRTREAQCRALDLLRFKLDLLWSMFDAIQLRYG
jgi:pyrroloquinoline-quinone synthase